MIYSMEDIINRKVKAMFDAHNKNPEYVFDNDELLEYNKKFKNFKIKYEFSKKYRESQLELLNVEMKKNPRFKQIIHKITGLNTTTIDWFVIDNLSMEKILKCINGKAKNIMLDKGAMYYSQIRNIHSNERYNRDFEIYNATKYMSFEEIKMIYRNHVSKLKFSNEGYSSDLQKNYVNAIYKRLINDEYIKADEKLKDSIIYEICTKILKDERCKFGEHYNIEHIDLMEILETKEFDSLKKLLEEESAFGRLKKSLSMGEKGKINAKKI